MHAKATRDMIGNKKIKFTRIYAKLNCYYNYVNNKNVNNKFHVFIITIRLLQDKFSLKKHSPRMNEKFRIKN